MKRKSKLILIESKRVFFAGLFAASCFVFAPACGKQSQTGKPGPLGSKYEAGEYYKTLKDDPSQMPAVHKKNIEAVKGAAAGSAERVKHQKVVRITDEEIRATVRVTWETLPVDGKHLIMSAALEGVEFSNGTSCVARDFKRQDSSEPFFDMVSISLECNRTDGSRHQVINRTFYWNGARNVNEPLLPNGELNIPGSGSEISDS